MTRAWFLTLPILLAMSVTAGAHEIRSGDLVIVHPMADEAEKGQAVSRGSVMIRNEGKGPDQLLSIKCEFAEEAIVESEVPLVIPAKSQAPLILRFKNIKRKLSTDEAYAGELMFKNAGTVSIDLMVHQPHPH